MVFLKALGVGLAPVLWNSAVLPLKSELNQC